MSISTHSRRASIDEIAAEMDRRGRVIEELEAQLAAKDAEIERLQNIAIDRGNKLFAANCDLFDARDLLAAATLRIASAEKVIRPFAKEADTWADGVPDKYRPPQPEPGTRMCNKGSNAKFSIGDLRAARSWLTQGKDGETHEG